MAHGICRAMLRDVHEAEDATQQTFLSAHCALLGGAHVRDEGAWIATIARNECRARIAAGMRTPLPVNDDDLLEIADGVDDAERRLQARTLREALEELPERQREAVVLRYVFGLRYGEVAKALGLSRPATEALLFRARRTLRVRLRHGVAVALAVPLSVRDELAHSLPGFEAQAGSGAAAAGVAGGIFAKLASTPAAAKLVTATVAVSTVGAVGAVESDRPAPGASAPVRLEAAAAAGQRSPMPVVAAAQGRSGGDEEPDGDRSGPGGGSDDAESRADDRGEGSSTSARGGDDERESSSRGRSGSGGRDDDTEVESEEPVADGGGGHGEGAHGGSHDDGAPDGSGSSQRSGSSSGSGSDHEEPTDGSSGSSGSSEVDDKGDSGSSGSGSGDELADEPDDESVVDS
jgi:RNA polymerase sigma-70 factor (ECF subfamily)